MIKLRTIQKSNADIYNRQIPIKQKTKICIIKTYYKKLNADISNIDISKCQYI